MNKYLHKYTDLTKLLLCLLYFFFPKMFQALFTASRLGVFDLLQSRAELDAAQVAQEIKASVKGTQSLLDACVSLGLLESRENCQSTLVSMDLCVTVTVRVWQMSPLMSPPSVPESSLHKRSFGPALPAVWGSSLSAGLHPALWPVGVASVLTPGVCREGGNQPAREGVWQESKPSVPGDTNCRWKWVKNAFENPLMQCRVFLFLRTLSTMIKRSSFDLWMPCIVLQKSQEKL